MDEFVRVEPLNLVEGEVIPPFLIRLSDIDELDEATGDTPAMLMLTARGGSKTTVENTYSEDGTKILTRTVTTTATRIHIPITEDCHTRIADRLIPTFVE